MGLEVFNLIEDLVDTNPVPGDNISQGDDHIKGIKTTLQNQFTGLGSTAVTVSAAEINDTPNKLASFNGRTATAAVPAANDYELDQLSDVDTTSTALADGDLLRYDSGTSEFKNVAFEYGFAHYDTYSSLVGDQPVFTNERSNTINSGGTAVIDNTGAAGTGWELTATVACIVQITFTVDGDGGDNDGIQCAIGLNDASTTFPGDNDASTVGYGRLQSGATGGDWDGTCTASANCILAATNRLTVYYDPINVPTRDDSGFKLTCTVIRLPE